MVRRTTSNRERSPGTITVRYVEETTLRSSRGKTPLPVRHYVNEYTAPADIRGTLKQFNKLSFDVYIPRDGRRRYVPQFAGEIEDYIGRAFHIGHSLLDRDLNWDRATFDDYLIGKLAYDWLRWVRERLRPRQFNLETLTVPRYLRGELLRSDVLPDQLGNDLSVSRPDDRLPQLWERGIAAAQRRGRANLSPTDVISYGLMEAAAEYPTTLTDPDEIRDLIRLALFDFSGVEADFCDDAFEAAADRFEEEVRKRLYVSQRDFNGWMHGEKAYLLQTVERHIACPDGVPRRAHARRHLLELGWRGFLQVSECLDAFARTFAKAQVKALTGEEQKMFSTMYRAQPHWGNLVLPLLLDAGDLLRPVMLDLWEDPTDSHAVGTLHRMLEYRSQIVPQLREMERLAKSRAPLKPSAEVAESDRPKFRVGWSSLCDAVIEQRGICCSSSDCTAPLCGKLDGSNTNTTEPVTITVDCPVHGFVQTLQLPREEILRQGRPDPTRVG